MPKYTCPKCDSPITIRSSNKRCFISCTCGISIALPDYDDEPNIAYLKFLDIMDGHGGSSSKNKRGGPEEIEDPTESIGLGDDDNNKQKPASVGTEEPAKRRRRTRNAMQTRGAAAQKPPPRQKLKDAPNALQGPPPTSPSVPKHRSKSEIEAMIKGKSPDETVRSLLFTKEYYVCQYTVSDSSGPEPGDAPHRLQMNPKLSEYLKSIGISRLHKFQQESYNVITGGRDVVIVAPTASGKTESFLIPIMQISSEIKSPMFALLVYPTKALARDQFVKIQAMAASVGISTAVFDGDTPRPDKYKIIESPPEILITNFDIINYHLPRRTGFASLLYGVRILVIDEVHTYTGIFGSNIHHLIRRLDRVCTHRLQLVAASATVDEPVRFCSALLDRDVELVKTDQRRGRIDTIIMSAHADGKLDMILDVTRQLMAKKHKTLVFNNSHRSAEIISLNAKRHNLDIRVHRSGIPLQDRHKAEDEFKNGDLMAISCTPTLEMGIDIGAVDGVVSSLVPVNRLLQRVGRAARRQHRGYAVLALGDDPISQYYENSPQDYFEDSEMLYIDSTNPIVQEYHVAAMSMDAPLHTQDVPIEHQPAIQRCVDAGLIQVHDDSIVPVRDSINRQLAEYNIRGVGESIRIMVNGRERGTRALPMALIELYTGATYYMGGIAYRVKNLDVYTSKTARLKKAEPYSASTYPEYVAVPTITKIHDTRMIWNTQMAHCTLKIQMSVTGYYRKKRPEKIIPLDVPHTYDYITKGLVFCAPLGDVTSDERNTPYGNVCHTIEHIIREGGSMITGGAAHDMGGISLGCRGAIFVYDNAVGGNGAARALYDKMEMVMERSAEILRLCPCRNDSGCPRCTYSYNCGHNNRQLHKLGGLMVLESIMRGDESRLEDVFSNGLYHT